MQNLAAADRIAKLQRHLQSHQLDVISSNSLKPQLVKAENDSKARPAPGGGPGTLTVTDSRTGKKYEIPISDHGTIKGTDLKKITAGGDGVGIRPYDNGCVRHTCCLLLATTYGNNDCFDVQICKYNSCQIQDIIHRWRQRDPAVPGLPYRAACRALKLPRSTQQSLSLLFLLQM